MCPRRAHKQFTGGGGTSFFAFDEYALYTYQYMGVHTDVYLCVVQSQNLLFQGQQQQKQPVITPPVSSKGVWCLAALSGVTVCLDVFPCRTHTHTRKESERARERERALQLVTGSFSAAAASLYNTQLSIQLLSSFIFFLCLQT